MLRESLKPATLKSARDLGPQVDAPILLEDPSRFSRFKPRQFLFSHEKGLRLQRAGLDRCIFYDEVQDLAIKKVERFTNGIHTITTYQISVRGELELISFTHNLPYDSKNGFLHLVQQLIAELAGRFDTRRILRGKDWWLDDGGLHFQERALSWEEIGYVDIIDHSVNIWRAKETYSFARISESSPNALVLNEILELHTKKNPHPVSSDGVGRFLFSRRSNRALLKLMVLLSAALLTTGLWLLTFGSPAIVPSFVLLFLSVPAAAYGLLSLRRANYFHQYGIIQEPGHKVLFYRQCESLAYDVNLQFVNDIYAFTRIEMKLQGPSSSIKIKNQCYGNDPEMEQARVEVSRKIADRLYQKVAAQQEVAWGKSARIGQHELYYVSSRVLGSNVRSTLPFTQPISYSIESGKFYLFRAGEHNPLFEMDCKEENFYPGLFLLLKLVAEH